MSRALLRVKDLKKHYPIHRELKGGPAANLKALDGITLDVHEGETLGLVGESGCGKTTLVNVALRLEDATSGSIEFDGKDLGSLSRKALRKLRAEMQIVFQDPFWSLDPRMLVRDIIDEPLRTHLKSRSGERFAMVEQLLEMVGLPRSAAFQYPHEFSGGERQRLAIARALGLRPRLVVLDEPTSAIDVLSQAQILMLLSSLKKELGLTYILVSHDLGVVSRLADRIAVLYLGKLVEIGPSSEVLRSPAHPYTAALLSAIPDTFRTGRLPTLAGELPSAIDPPSGCRFRTRCVEARPACSGHEPNMVPIGDGQSVACLNRVAPEPLSIAEGATHTIAPGRRG